MIRLTTATLALLALAPDDGDKFWKFKKGTTWTYEESADGKKKKIVITVTKEDGGKIWSEEKDTPEGETEPSKTKKLATYVEDGHIVWAEEKDEKLDVRLKLLKLGAKKGDKWKSPMGGAGTEVEVEHMGTEELKIAAGTYKDAVRLQFKMDVGDQQLEANFWLVPGVGLARMEMKMAADTFSVELQKFEEGK